MIGMDTYFEQQMCVAAGHFLPQTGKEEEEADSDTLYRIQSLAKKKITTWEGIQFLIKQEKKIALLLKQCENMG